MSLQCCPGCTPGHLLLLGWVLGEILAISSSVLALCLAWKGWAALRLPAALSTAGGGSYPWETRVLQACVSA